MKVLHSIESIYVSGGWSPPWYGVYQSNLAKPGAGAGGSSSGSSAGGSVPSGPGVNIPPSPDSAAYQPIVPGGEDNNGLG